MSLSAESSDALAQAVRKTFAPATLARLAGDTAFLTPNGMTALNLAPRQRFQESSYLVLIEAWLRANWLALPVILTGVSGVLFVGLRLALDQYKRTRAIL